METTEITEDALVLTFYQTFHQWISIREKQVYILGLLEQTKLSRQSFQSKVTIRFYLCIYLFIHSFSSRFVLALKQQLTFKKLYDELKSDSYLPEKLVLFA